MGEQSISYFRELLSKHIKELKESCRNWENTSANEILPEEVSDEIRTTIGLTNLLMRQKMKQFGDLIDDSEFKRTEKEVTYMDLQGFWDMVYNEVEKIQKSFNKLEKCRENDWTFVQESINKTKPKKKSKFGETVKLTVAAKGHASAARQRLAEAKLKMKQVQLVKNDFEVEVIIATKNSLNTPLNSQSKKRNESKEIVDEQSECTTMANLHISKPKVLQEENSINSSSIISTPNELTKGKHKDMKSAKKPSTKKNKENVLLTPGENFTTSLPNTPVEKASDTPASHTKRKKAKDLPPLQCITRSAKKALLAKENASKN